MIVMPVYTFEAITDDDGNIRLADTVRLPGHTKVYVVVPEQTTAFSQIAPDISTSPASALRYPLVRVTDEGLTKRLVKTVVEDACAEV
jgi:hypothetical protein